MNVPLGRSGRSWCSQTFTSILDYHCQDLVDRGVRVRVMSAQKVEDRARLDGFEIEIFKLVSFHATSEQWKEWLRAPLEHAALTGNTDLFTRLMDAGADGSAGWRGCHGRTLLGAAACSKNEKMVHALLEAGAKDDVNVVFEGIVGRQSALHVAVGQGAEAISVALLRAGANPNLEDDLQQTPLHLAALMGYHSIVSGLLLRGADPNAKNIARSGVTALHLAAERGHVLCVSELLLGGAEKDSRCRFNETPLHRAVERNRLGAAEELLKAGANVNIRSSSGRSVLDTAGQWGYVDTLAVLLRHGGDVNSSGNAGNTPLHSAASFEGLGGNGGAVRLLLAAGADIEAKTDYGFSPLLCAAHSVGSSCGTICALLEGGADVNAVLESGEMPLHTVCCRSNADAVELLLRWGADETVLNGDGETALELVGDWRDGCYDDGREERRNADCQRIRHMLARAPADRSWRRRGWLVLCRDYPSKVNLTKDGDGIGSSAKVAKACCDVSGGNGNEVGDRMIDWTSLVGRVVGLEAEGVFRLLVGFL